jgi:predicted nucleotidyltransferase
MFAIIKLSQIMEVFPLDIKVQTKVANFLIKKVSPYLVYIFGSTIKGTSNRNSDIDIAYLSDQNFDEYEIFMLAQELADIINIDVDLIDLKKASTVFQGQIVSTGRVIYCVDNIKRMDYEMRALKMYAKLNEERQFIIDNVQESGSIFNEE